MLFGVACKAHRGILVSVRNTATHAEPSNRLWAIFRPGIRQNGSRSCLSISRAEVLISAYAVQTRLIRLFTRAPYRWSISLIYE